MERRFVFLAYRKGSRTYLGRCSRRAFAGSRAALWRQRIAEGIGPRWRPAVAAPTTRPGRRRAARAEMRSLLTRLHFVRVDRFPGACPRRARHRRSELGCVRKLKFETKAGMRRLLVQFQCPAVLQCDGSGNAQPQPHAFAYRLGRKERLHDVRPIFRGNSRAAIAD